VTADGQHDPLVPSDDDPGNEPLGVASVLLGIVGLFLGIVTIFGVRGVALALGIVAVILAGTAVRRASNEQERGTAYGGLVLGTVTLVVGIVVLNR
jgi:FtsH-binding integral membrane protein